MKRWEELREELIGWLESSCFDGDPRTWGPDAEKDIDAIIAAVREDEREKIAENGQHFELGDDVSGSDYLTCVHLQQEVDFDVSVIAEEDCYIVPASVLAPKESEP